MFIQRLAGDYGFAAFAASLVASLRPTPLSGGVANLLRADDLVGTYNWARDATAQNVGYALVSDAEQAVIVLDGSSNLSQVTDFVNGAGSTEVNNTILGANPALDRMASRIRIQAGLGGTFNFRRISVIGWSLGGACGLVLGAQLARQYPTSSVDVTTFGSPRPGTHLLGEQNLSISTYRWMNEQDPIPRVLPRFTEWAAMAYLIPRSVCRQWSDQSQGAGGRVVSDGGLVRESVLPGVSTIGTVSNLITWMAGLDAPGTGPHAIQAYQANLQAAANISGVYPGLTARPSPVEARGLIPRAPFMAAQQAAAHAIRVAQGNQDSVPVQIPPTRAFTYARLHQGYAIYFNGNQVAMTSLKRTARAMCRDGNVFLRRLQRMGVVDAVGIATEFTSYIAAAQDASEGFSPPLNVA